MQLDTDSRPAVWILSELPVIPSELPSELVSDIKGAPLYIIEEHVANGGAGQQISHALLQNGIIPSCYNHRCALGYVSGRYGSQRYHRKECGLDPDSIAELFLAGK